MTRRTLRPMMLALVVLAATPLLASCRLNPVEKPTVTVQAVQVRSISFTGIDLRLDLSIYNPNSFSVPLKSAEWRLALVGEDAVTGRADLADNIPAHQNAPVQVGVRIGAAQAANIGSRIAGGQNDYRLDGNLTFTTRVGDLTVAYSQSGQLTRR